MFLIKNNHWEVKETPEKGRGVFAKKNILKGTVIGDYIGKVIKTEEYDLDNDRFGLYLMYLTDEACIYPDLSRPGIHLINHSCNPNCWIYTFGGHTLFFAIKDIAPKDELTISYLLCPKDDLCNPCTHDCKCKSKSCIGTMHTSEANHVLWQNFQNNSRKNEADVEFEFNKNLPKLENYPKILDDDPIYSVINQII